MHSVSLPDLGQDTLGQPWVYKDVLNFTSSNHAVEIRVGQFEDFLILLPVILRHHPVHQNRLKKKKKKKTDQFLNSAQKPTLLLYYIILFMLHHNTFYRSFHRSIYRSFSAQHYGQVKQRNREKDNTKGAAIHTRYAMRTWIQKEEGTRPCSECC